MVEHRAATFQCGTDLLHGIFSLPKPIEPSMARRGVLIVVGGPQYRVGSHRQFALLASALAARQIPVMRFDYRGMGDSEGAARSFEGIDDDIRSALDAFSVAVPGMSEVVLWGLCDGASAALFYAYQDRRVTGLVLLNPWVRTDQGLAKAYLRHYYVSRLLKREVWSKIFTGEFQFKVALGSFAVMLKTAMHSRNETKKHFINAEITELENQSLPNRMLNSLERFNGNVLIILSGNDLTAQEFLDLINASPRWCTRMNTATVSQKTLADANHTFSQKRWREQVANWTIDWIKSW